jgi:hypothetical protein
MASMTPTRTAVWRYEATGRGPVIGSATTAVISCSGFG